MWSSHCKGRSPRPSMAFVASRSARFVARIQVTVQVAVPPVVALLPFLSSPCLPRLPHLPRLPRFPHLPLHVFQDQRCGWELWKLSVRVCLATDFAQKAINFFPASAHVNDFMANAADFWLFLLAIDSKNPNLFSSRRRGDGTFALHRFFVANLCDL